MVWQSKSKIVRPHVLALPLLALIMTIGWFYTQHYAFTRSWVPAWPLPAAQESAAGDWVTIELLTNELTAETTAVSVQVAYSLQSQPEMNLLIHLRSRLDLDVVDLGSDLSNVVAFEMIEVVKGEGQFLLEIPLERRVLSRFPVGSQIIPFATLTKGGYPQIAAQTALFHRPFVTSALSVPDYEPICLAAAEHPLLQDVAFSLPESGRFSEADPYAQAIVQVNAAVPQADLLTVVAGLANPAWDDVAVEWSDWTRHSSLSYQPFSPDNDDSMTLTLYSWFVTAETEARTAQIVDEEWMVVPAVAVVCGDFSGRTEIALESVVGDEKVMFFGR